MIETEPVVEPLIEHVAEPVPVPVPVPIVQVPVPEPGPGPEPVLGLVQPCAEMGGPYAAVPGMLVAVSPGVWWCAGCCAAGCWLGVSCLCWCGG